MKKSMLFIVLVFFAGAVSALGTTSEEDCACSGSQETSKNGKLLDAREITKGFEQGESRVKVIVNLVEPPQAPAVVDWKSSSSLKKLQREIHTHQRQVLDILPVADFTLRHRFQNQAGFSGEITQEGLERLLEDSRVKSIEPVRLCEEHLAQGIPLINAAGYRPIYNGQGVAIAICDTGVDYTHSKLGGGGFPNSKVIGGYDFGDNDGDPYPYGNSAHGTSCAGIAAGDLGTVGDYIGGVAPGAKLIALKVANSSGSIHTDKIIASWDWCITHKDDNPSYPILIISNSLGSGRYPSTCDGSETAFATAANNVVAAGITMVVSSGNEGFCDSLALPACLSNTISVGGVHDAAFGTYTFCVDEDSCATPGGGASCDPSEFSTMQVTASDVVAVYTNVASFLDIFAPAHKTHTTDISGSGGYNQYGDYVTDFGGTSASSPYAAGAVACLQSAAKELIGSYLSPSEVKYILTSTGDDITDDKVAITKPRINLDEAISSIGIIVENQYFSTDVPKDIPDWGTTTSTLDISGIGIIIDLNVKLNISHVYDDDLDVFLIAPDSTRVELFTDVGNDGDNFSNTILDDEASIPITSGTAPFNGSYRPEGSLSLFDGKSPTGVWTLEVTDDSGSDTGTLNSWSLTIQILVNTEPNAPVLHPEPNITPGLCNTISWNLVPEAIVYYVQCSSDPGFSSIVGNSGWISEAYYEFCGLTNAQVYWYRVKSAYSASGGPESPWSGVESSRQCGTPGDFEPDCDVDLADLAVLVEQWLETPGTPSADIAPAPDGDDVVNLLDFAELAVHWLEGIE